MVIELGLSDFDKMSIAAIRMYYSKQKSTFLHDRKLKGLTKRLL